MDKRPLRTESEPDKYEGPGRRRMHSCKRNDTSGSVTAWPLGRNLEGQSVPVYLTGIVPSYALSVCVASGTVDGISPCCFELRFNGRVTSGGRTRWHALARFTVYAAIVTAGL